MKHAEIVIPGLWALVLLLIVAIGRSIRRDANGAAPGPAHPASRAIDARSPEYLQQITASADQDAFADVERQFAERDAEDKSLAEFEQDFDENDREHWRYLNAALDRRSA